MLQKYKSIKYININENYLTGGVSEILSPLSNEQNSLEKGKKRRKKEKKKKFCY